MMKDQLYHILTKFYPGFVRDRMKIMLEYAGEDTQVEYWMGKTTIIGLLILFLSTLAGYFYIKPPSAAAVLILTAFFLYLMAAYLIVFFKAEQRSSAVEKILPSYLHFVAANINSGLTPYQAMKASSRKEFGLLKEELDGALGLSLGAMTFSKSLLSTTKRIKSSVYKKFIELFVDGMTTGGKLSALLEDLAKDIIENMDLKKEIVTRSKSYILFIVFTVVIGGPLLSSVSIHFISTIGEIRQDAMNELVGAQEVILMPMAELNLTADFLTTVTTINIMITGFIASWLMAVIRDGQDKMLVKYGIWLIPSSLLMFNLFKWLINTFL